MISLFANLVSRLCRAGQQMTMYLSRAMAEIERDEMITKTAWIRKIYKDIERDEMIMKTA